MAENFSQIHYLAARQAKMSLQKKMAATTFTVTQKMVFSYIDYSLTIAEFWSDNGLSDYQVQELVDLHVHLLETSKQPSIDSDTRNTCIHFADSVFHQCREIRQSKLN